MADEMHMLRSGTLEDKKDMLERRKKAAESTSTNSRTVQCPVRTSSSLTERKSMFAEQVATHEKKMASNVFSGHYTGRPIGLKKDDPNYGKPVAGSKSERRGLQAAARVNGEVALLCEMIYMEGEKHEDGTASIRFGELFQIYTRISNKVVGMLLRARKYGLVHFEGEMLFQGQNDHTIINLLKPQAAIRAELAMDKTFEVGVCHRAKQ